MKREDYIAFGVGMGVYLGLLFLCQKVSPLFIIPCFILAPFSLLGMAAEVFKDVIWSVLIGGVISVLQGGLYVLLYRFYKRMGQNAS